MLKVSQLSKTYKDGTVALNNISLELSKGMVGLLGPNGAGKSSLMRTIACLQSPSKGELFFNNIDLQQSPEHLRAQLGYLPQEFGVYPHMSCERLLDHIAILKGLNAKQRRNQIGELLDMTNLTRFRNKTVANFSGGMRQRFGIAQALLGEPKILILDEPCAGLDPLEREKINQLLVNISQEKLIILSTHIVEDVENLCSFVTIMNQGSIIEKGDINNLVSPLRGKVWLISQLPKDASKLVVLGRHFHHGKMEIRIFCSSSPGDFAKPVEPTLNDCYFYLLDRAVL